jgi:acetyl esterase/lipase
MRLPTALFDRSIMKPRLFGPLFLLLLASLVLLPAVLPAQRLLEAKMVATLKRSQLDSIRHASHVPRRLAPVTYDVAIYDVLYYTAWADGSPVVASGYLMVPVGAKSAVPLLAYDHGTRLEKARTWAFRGEEAVCAFYAADGYLVAFPDYVGLRRGERNHLYHHAATEAMATVDLLRAAREFMPQIGLTWSEQLFITGYSQGGHAAMATHKYIQERLQGEFTVTASAPMSGPYDLAGVQGRVLDKPYSQPGYLPYILVSYQAAYHLLPDSGDYFRPPYDTLIPRLFTGKMTFDEVNPFLPAIPGDMMREDLLLAYATDSANPLRRLMQENSLTDWAPESPMLLCYCRNDEQVNYENSLVAHDRMTDLGAHAVQLRQAGRKFHHGRCSIYTSIYARMWFNSIRDGHPTGKKGPLWNRFLVNMSKLFMQP